MIKVGSDFSGVGAFDQALMRLGINYKTIFSCDMDKYARQTYIENYGEPDYYPADVYDREIPKDSLDIYMTSPPCQAFSIFGKRLGKKDKRGILFFNSHEFIQKNNPRYFIFENVKGLLSHEEGKTFQEWINYLGGKSINGLPVLFPDENAAPYHLYYKILNSKNLNVPQNRERIFIIGIRDDQDNHFRWPKYEPLTKKLKDIIEIEAPDKYFLDDKSLNNLTKKDEYINVQSKLWIADYRYDEGLRIRKDGNSPCIHTRDAHLINYSGKIRRLTPKECFRLMDFPDSFTWPVSDSQAYKQAGNSIVVKCLEKIIEKFRL
jgi:DNA (cytosine-5)-methyltransferase 1